MTKRTCFFFRHTLYIFRLQFSYTRYIYKQFGNRLIRHIAQLKLCKVFWIGLLRLFTLLEQQQTFLKVILLFFSSSLENRNRILKRQHMNIVLQVVLPYQPSCPSVGRLIGQSVCRSVCHYFLKRQGSYTSIAPITFYIEG